MKHIGIIISEEAPQDAVVKTLRKIRAKYGKVKETTGMFVQGMNVDRTAAFSKVFGEVEVFVDEEQKPKQGDFVITVSDRETDVWFVGRVSQWMLSLFQQLDAKVGRSRMWFVAAGRENLEDAAIHGVRIIVDQEDHAFSPHEKLELHEGIRDLWHERDRLLETVAELNEQMKEAKKDAESKLEKIGFLMDDLDNGFENRDVIVVRERVPGTADTDGKPQWKLYEVTTGRYIRQNEMTVEERQIEIDAVVDDGQGNEKGGIGSERFIISIEGEVIELVIDMDEVREIEAVTAETIVGCSSTEKSEEEIGLTITMQLQALLETDRSGQEEDQWLPVDIALRKVMRNNQPKDAQMWIGEVLVKWQEGTFDHIERRAHVAVDVVDCEEREEVTEYSVTMTKSDGEADLIPFDLFEGAVVDKMQSLDELMDEQNQKRLPFRECLWRALNMIETEESRQAKRKDQEDHGPEQEEE